MRMKTILPLPILLGLLYTSCARGQSNNAIVPLQKPMTIGENETKNEADIRALIDHFANAFRAKDVEGCMSVFAPGIVSFDIVPPLQTIGAGVFVTHWQEFFDSYQGPIHAEFPDVSIIAGDDVAYSYCLHRIAGTLKSGHKTDFWLRWTACWRMTNGRWLIVHEQVSVPVDLASGKALMDLKP
jgi:ketosteroid isomerase-like protein